jgi:hypothetical protein
MIESSLDIADVAYLMLQRLHPKSAADPISRDLL